MKIVRVGTPDSAFENICGRKEIFITAWSGEGGCYRCLSQLLSESHKLTIPIV